MKPSIEKERSLTAEMLREILSYDPVTGVFRWLKASRAHIGKEAGTLRKNGYRFIQIDGWQHSGHRLAWLYVHGEWPAIGVDHVDTVRSHNWISNLRLATSGQNRQNQRRAHARNVGGLLGASYCKERDNWRAMIMVDGRSRYLGRFATKEAANAAYLSAKVELHPFQTIVQQGVAA